MGRAEDLYKKIVDDQETALDEFIRDRKHEELYLDFKQSGDSGQGETLHASDRKNLSKAISGFGNSEGGIIVWGIKCKDNAEEKLPIHNVRRFVARIEDAVSGCTLPPHKKVENSIIQIPGSADGYAVTYISKSDDAPHQHITDSKFYIRAGSSFHPTPYGVLASLFGRRPQSKVYHNFATEGIKIVDNSVNLKSQINLYNNGPVTASDLFMVLQIESIVDNCTISPMDLNSCNGNSAFSQIFSIISKPDIKIPPKCFLSGFLISLSISPPFPSGIEIHGVCGSNQSPPFQFLLKNTPMELEEIHKESLKLYNSGLLNEENAFKMASRFFNGDEASKGYEQF